MNVAFDEYAGRYDSALNKELSLSGTSKEYFAEARVRLQRSSPALGPLEAKLTCIPAGSQYLVFYRRAAW